MAKKNDIQIIIEAVDKATGTFNKINDGLGGLGSGVGIAAGAVVAGGIAIGAAVYGMAESAAPLELTRNTFNNLADSINQDSAAMLADMRSATNGMVADQALMAASNKFVAMGLADTATEVSDLTKMSTQLSLAMGMDATQGAADFAAMLANQSIPRLDNYGISSANVRARIEELMAADANLAREDAFMQAVMEEGQKTMQRVGDQSLSNAGKFAAFQSTIQNVKDTVGTALVPILGVLSDVLTPIVNNLVPVFVTVAGELGAIFSESIVPVIVQLAESLLPALMQILSPLLSTFGQLAGSLLGSLVPALVQLLSAFMPIIQAILPPLISLISTVVSWLVSKLVPVIEVVAAWVGKNLPVAFDYLAKLWKNTLQPALSGLWDFLTKIWDAFKKIGDAVSKVIQFFKDLVAEIKNIKLPDWLTPGSPTPFEIGLRGIADALSDVNAIAPTTFSGLPDGSVVGGGSSVSNQPLHLELHIHTPINLADRNFAERELMPYIESGVRQLLARAA